MKLTSAMHEKVVTGWWKKRTPTRRENNYNIMVLGNRDKIELDTLGKVGQVTELELQEIFGY